VISAVISAKWLGRLRACAGVFALLTVGGAFAADPPANPATTDDPPAEPADYWTGPIHAPVPATLSGGTVVHTAQLQTLLERDDVVLVEVSNAPRRPENLAPNAPWLPTPHVVIPGSLWIAGAGMGAIAPDAETSFRDQLTHATGADLDHPIVVYCHEQCWLSWNAAKRAVRLGYRQVHWYPEGIEGWRAAGLETSVAAESAASTAAAPSPAP
jgi:PQQ-dependent catabolism-associated CXXCW motif protein